jgi:hypothetical protein
MSVILVFDVVIDVAIDITIDVVVIFNYLLSRLKGDAVSLLFPSHNLYYPKVACYEP